MARRKAKVAGVREWVLADIDDEIELAKEHVRRANDLTDLLNLLEDGEPKLKAVPNVVPFEKKDTQ